jgi:hypothetical protein
VIFPMSWAAVSVIAPVGRSPLHPDDSISLTRSATAPTIRQ